MNNATDAPFPPPAALPALAELPDALRFPDGEPLRDSANWPELRREHLARILHYQYGELPSLNENVWQETWQTASSELAGADITESVMWQDEYGEDMNIPLIVTRPTSGGPFPAIITGDLRWGRRSPEIVAEVVRWGYALAEFDRTRIGPDSKERGGIYARLPDYDGGRIAAWAWGFHRVVDLLLLDPEMDGSRIIVTGHSRGGKAALLAGALDERIALTAPNNSGCGGAGCYRRQAEGSEDIAAILKTFPYWFHPRFADFIGGVNRLPFDQHTLKACIAPRLLLTTEATGDLWANPQGTGISHEAAKPVFHFLGVPDNIAVHFRQGGHEQNLADWLTLLDFADANLLQMGRLGVLTRAVSDS